MILSIYTRGALVASHLALALFAFSSAPLFAKPNASSACPGNNGGLSLSPGFCATIFADNMGHVRHMVMAPNGVLYVNSWSVRSFGNDQPEGAFLVALKDSKGTGKADVIERFGGGSAEGSRGGTGIAFYKGAIFAEQNEKIIRFALPDAGFVPTDAPETIVSDLPLTGDHPMHPFVINAKGELYVDLGSATNTCQNENRMTGSLGQEPCTEKNTRAGTWLYDANKIDQKFSSAERFSTGLRNGEGFSFDSAGRLFATQHGRDQLSQNFPKLYTPAQSAELPAEELVQLEKGADFGWPECYYDGAQKKLVLAPEYRGDGGRKVGVCAGRNPPVAAFPAHWAPNDLLIYTGKAFPTAYRDGAFIAFHGSWNRAPLPQGGYNIVFQPLADGKASGDFVVFADGFAGAIKEPGRAAFRPTGLAMGTDGALYISDDKHGRIWRVTYQGGETTNIQSAASALPAAVSDEAVPPQGRHLDIGRPDSTTFPVPPGATKQDVVLGDRIFHGEASNGTCSGCHGSDAKGSPQAPSLVSGTWVQGNGSLEALTKTITQGIPKSRNYSNPMPARGGAQLSDADIAAVADYVWAISRSKSK
jgi:glucose/arabinose dehydrogenase/mono/diheme cytochrome c family protein